MFRKIEIWFLYLSLFLSFIFTIAFGALVKHEINGAVTLKKYNLGWISEAALFLANIPSNIAHIFHDTDIKVVDRFPQLTGFNGTPNSEESYLLLSRYDGDLQEGLVELINLTNFEVIHTWNPDINKFNSLVEQVNEFEFLDRDSNNQRLMLGHPKLTYDGGLLFHSGPLRKINSCSELIFQNIHDSFHHSIETDIEGNIWVPSHLYPQTLSQEKIGRNTPARNGFLDDAIVKLNPNGEVIFEKSVAQIFIENGLEYLLFSVGDRKFDIDPIHLNDIQPVNSDTDYWKKGDIFLSLRHQSMVLLYRPSTNKIVWKFTGPIFHQHDVDILDDHRISIFNNNSKDYEDRDSVDMHNEIIIYNFKTGKYSSYLKDSLSNNEISTITNGLSQILPNGDLFVEETKSGRTLYFNADGSLRWVHVNRAKNGGVFLVKWSRILFLQEDLKNVNNFLKNRLECNE